MMKTDFDLIAKDAEQWENRDLGASEEHVAVVPDKEDAAIDDQLGLQAISIRLPKSLIAQLKEIAARHEIGYQPMVRDLLNRFAQAEQKKYLLDCLSQVQAAEKALDDTSPVSDFIENIKKQA